MDNIAEGFERDKILNLDNFYQLQKVLLVKQDRNSKFLDFWLYQNESKI
jgi:hypothetical protein